MSDREDDHPWGTRHAWKMAYARDYARTHSRMNREKKMSTRMVKIEAELLMYVYDNLRELLALVNSGSGVDHNNPDRLDSLISTIRNILIGDSDATSS